MSEEKQALVADLEAKLAEAIAANEALLEFERTTSEASPRLTFAPLNAEQVARWRAHVAAVRAGKTRQDF